MAIWFAMQKRFETIIILGSDFDFFKGFQTNQYDNTVSFSVAHFYGNDSNAENQRKLEIRISHFMCASQVSMAFQQLHVLERYAQILGLNIVNGSSFSLIDAFSRGPKH